MGNYNKNHILRRYLALFLLLLIVFLAITFGPSFLFIKVDGHYGIWSIAPPLLAIVLAYWTREVITSLFIGICFGGLISGNINVVQAFLIPSIATESFAMILLVYLWALGGLIGIWTRTGGAETFARWGSKKMVQGPKTAKLFAWIMGIVFHQGGTISTVLTGATVRPVADKHRVSHEELSYIVDSTSSPAATIIPFNIWPFYISGLVLGTIPLFTTTMDGVNFFFSSILFNFYGLLAVTTTFLFAIEKAPWIPSKKMKAAIARSRNGEGLDSASAKPMAAEELSTLNIPKGYTPGLIDFFGPIGSLLGIAIIPFIFSYFILGQKDNPTLLISEAFVSALLVAIGIAVIKGMALSDIIDGFVGGCKGVTIGGIILALAVSLKEVAVALGTADYVISIMGTSLSPTFLPGILMLLCMLIAFATGTSWGTYAVVFPIAMPLAWSIAPDPLFIKLCFGAVVGGSVFGDQCSPISDTTILSALATGCDLVDHVMTQLPLALLTALVSVLFYCLICFVWF
jgi:Na+/H+ antiporter NhaC